MSERETIADIIRKIRAEADYIEETARGSFKAGENYDGIAYTESDLESALHLAETKRKEADRLEAAIKREVDKLNSAIQATVGRSDAEIDRLRCKIAKMRQAGDAAKLREAVKRIVAASIVAKNANAPEWILQRMADIFAVATTALAAPPRNCDLYKTKEEAQEAFLKEPCDHPCGICWVGDINNECGVDWLFAPATEQKGGNDAD